MILMIFRWNKIGVLRCGGAVCSGTDVGGEFFLDGASLLLFSQPWLRCYCRFNRYQFAERRIVLVEWNGFLCDFVIVVLANDKHGGCVGV